MKRLSFLLLFLFVFGAAAPDAGPGENAAHLYAAVSYTHLTLPTN